MKTVLVRYKTRDDRASENERTAWMSALDEPRETAPAGLRYRSLKVDGSTFVHLAEIDTADGSNPLNAMDSFKRFQQGLRERGRELPVASDLIVVDGYAAP